MVVAGCCCCLLRGFEACVLGACFRSEEVEVLPEGQSVSRNRKRKQLLLPSRSIAERWRFPKTVDAIWDVYFSCGRLLKKAAREGEEGGTSPYIRERVAAS